MTATGGEPQGAFIFLHGSGDTGEGIADWLQAESGGRFAEQMEAAGIRVVFPDAPFVPYTLAGGALQTVWFDRRAMAYEAPEDVAGLARSVEQVDAEVDKLVESGIPMERIGVGGFSMGAGVALHAGFGNGRHAGRVAMVASISTFLAKDSALDGVATARFGAPGARAAPPFFAAHGEADPMIRPEWARSTWQRLEEAGVPATSNTRWFPGMGHQLCEPLVQELADFVIRHIGAAGKSTSLG